MAKAASQAGWKIFGGVSAILAGIAVRKVLTTVWTKVTGRTPPTNPVSPGTSWPEALSWAAASGVAMGVARMLATRQAARTWAKASGSLPPGVEEVS